eukprot:gene32010-16530_t
MSDALVVDYFSPPLRVIPPPHRETPRPDQGSSVPASHEIKFDFSLPTKDMGPRALPPMSSLEDAIVVCQERWDFEWKAKFDEQSLMMEAAWEVSGIAGLTAIDHQMWKENK